MVKKIKKEFEKRKHLETKAVTKAFCPTLQKNLHKHESFCVERRVCYYQSHFKNYICEMSIKVLNNYIEKLNNYAHAILMFKGLYLR